MWHRRGFKVGLSLVTVVVCCLLGSVMLRPVTAAAACLTAVWETPVSFQTNATLQPLTSDLVVAQRINVTTTFGISSLTFQLNNTNSLAELVVGVGVSTLRNNTTPEWDFGQQPIVATNAFYTYNYSAGGALNLPAPSVYFITLRMLVADGGQSLVVGASGPQPGVQMPFAMLDLSISSDGSAFIPQGTSLLAMGVETCTNPSPSPLPSVSSLASSSPSLSPRPLRFLALTTNVTAAFDVAQPAINMSAPLFATASSEVVQLTAEFSEVALGNVSVPASSISEFNRTNINATYSYSAQVDKVTVLDQEFTFHKGAASGNFSGLSFVIGAGNLKWSVRLNSLATVPGPTVIRYRLSSFLSAGAYQPVPKARVLIKPGQPQARMTTYLVPLLQQSTGVKVYARVELFDFALVNNSVDAVTIDHDIIVQPSSGSSSSTSSEYVLELRFPAFEGSLEYDPSIGMGVVLGQNEGGGGSDVGLIVGVAVAVAVAVALVLVVIAGALIIGWRRSRANSAGAVQFDEPLTYEEAL